MNPTRKNKNKPSLSKKFDKLTLRTASRPVGKIVQPKRFPTGVVGMNRRSATIIEDEYLFDISSTTAFTTTKVALNPGQSATFPWLYKIASQWEKYHINSIEFYYKPEASAYAAAAQTGKVILSFDYDAADVAPTSKTQVEDTDPHADAMPYEEVCLVLDPLLLNDTPTGKYVRPGALPANTDIKTYDAGNLWVSTYGTASGGVCGEIRVRYSITLEKPVIETIVPQPATGGMAYFTASGALTGGATTVPTLFVLNVSNINTLGAVLTAGVVALLPGVYSLYVQTVYSVQGAETNVDTALVGATSSISWDNAGVSIAGTLNGTVHGCGNYTNTTNVSIVNTLVFSSGDPGSFACSFLIVRH